MIESLNPQTAQAILVLCSVVIALCALLTGLGFIFNMLLAPVKEKQVVFEAKLGSFETELKEVKQNQARFEKRLGSIEAKLDLLLKANGKG